eukprot:gene23433-29651_t
MKLDGLFMFLEFTPHHFSRYTYTKPGLLKPNHLSEAALSELYSKDRLTYDTVFQLVSQSSRCVSNNSSSSISSVTSTVEEESVISVVPSTAPTTEVCKTTNRNYRPKRFSDVFIGKSVKFLLRGLYSPNDVKRMNCQLSSELMETGSVSTTVVEKTDHLVVLRVDSMDAHLQVTPNLYNRNADLTQITSYKCHFSASDLHSLKHSADPSDQHRYSTLVRLCSKSKWSVNHTKGMASLSQMEEGSVTLSTVNSATKHGSDITAKPIWYTSPPPSAGSQLVPIASVVTSPAPAPSHISRSNTSSHVVVLTGMKRKQHHEPPPPPHTVSLQSDDDSDPHPARTDNLANKHKYVDIGCGTKKARSIKAEPLDVTHNQRSAPGFSASSSTFARCDQKFQSSTKTVRRVVKETTVQKSTKGYTSAVFTQSNNQSVSSVASSEDFLTVDSDVEETQPMFAPRNITQGSTSQHHTVPVIKSNSSARVNNRPAKSDFFKLMNGGGNKQRSGRTTEAERLSLQY